MNTTRLTIRCPQGAAAGDTLVVMDASGVTHLVSVPSGAVAERGLVADTFSADIPAEAGGLGGDPASGFGPNELATGGQLGSLLLAHWAAERVDELLLTLDTWLPQIKEGGTMPDAQLRPIRCARGARGNTYARARHARTHHMILIHASPASQQRRIAPRLAHAPASIRPLLHTHLLHSPNVFLVRPSAHAPIAAFLASIMEQTAYCARALSRIGLDFSPLARLPFRSAVLGILDSGLDAAKDHWVHMIRSHRWSASHASAAAIAALKPSAGSATTSEAGSGGGGSADGDGVSGNRVTGLSPPMALLQHPPVAVLLNHLMATLNELRPCGKPNIPVLPPSPGLGTRSTSRPPLPPA